MPSRISNAWNYVLEAIRSHPFNFFTLLIAAAALYVSIRARSEATRQAEAAERQASSSEEALRVQTEALKTEAENTERALQLAGRGAEIAEESLKTSRTLGENSIRAWVVVADIRTSDFKIAGKFGVTTELINVGETPAISLKALSRLVLTPELPETIEIPATAGQSEVTIGSKQVFTPFNHVDLEPLDKQNMMQGRMKLVLMGIATYEDIFGNERKTTWCAYFEPSQGRFVGAPKLNTIT